MSSKEHRKAAPKTATIGIVTVSTTRALADDKSGSWIAKRAKKEKYDVLFHEVIPDDKAIIRETVFDFIRRYTPDAILITGGTGISSKDVTIEAIRPMLDKELTAFGCIFSQLSFEEIDSAALLSRATAGVAGKTLLFCMPGSLAACKLACKTLIFPELGHMVKHLFES